MTYRYEWRALSYAAFLTDDYPPFEFMPAGTDDGHQSVTALTIAYPERLNRWKPLYKWVLANIKNGRLNDLNKKYFGSDLPELIVKQ
jgi:hypothetical protein